MPTGWGLRVLLVMSSDYLGRASATYQVPVPPHTGQVVPARVVPLPRQ